MAWYDKIPVVAGAKALGKSKGVKDVLLGKKDKNKQLTTITPEQQELNALIQQGLVEGQGPLADLFKGEFDQEGFEKGVTQPALKNFQENILPSIQEKFIGSNRGHGSAMRRGQLKAGNQLQSDLAALMYQAQNQQKTQQDANRLTGIAGLQGNRNFENVYKQGTEGLLQGAVKGFAGGLGKASGGAIAG